MLLQCEGIKMSNQSRSIKDIDNRIETLLTNITKLQKQVEDLLAWKETTEINSDPQKLLKRLAETDKLLDFGLIEKNLNQIEAFRKQPKELSKDEVLELVKMVKKEMSGPKKSNPS